MDGRHFREGVKILGQRYRQDSLVNQANLEVI